MISPSTSALPITARLAHSDDDPLWSSIAIHETAHILVAAALGSKPYKIEIRFNGTGSAHHSALAPEDALVALRSGEVAELILGARTGDVVLDCSFADATRARAIAADLDNPDGSLSRARWRADSLLREHWGGLERLADLLVDAWTLRGDLLAALIGAALADAPDLVAGANQILERQTAAKRADVVLVERRLDFERRIASLRAEGGETPAAVAAAWREAERHAGVAAERAVPARRVVLA
jgi:hypothetical protein